MGLYLNIALNIIVKKQKIGKKNIPNNYSLLFSMYRHWAKDFEGDCTLFFQPHYWSFAFCSSSILFLPLALCSIIGDYSSQVSLPAGGQWNCSKEDTGEGAERREREVRIFLSLSLSLIIDSSCISSLAPAPAPSLLPCSVSLYSRYHSRYSRVGLDPMVQNMVFHCQEWEWLSIVTNLWVALPPCLTSALPLPVYPKCLITFPLIQNTEWFLSSWVDPWLAQVPREAGTTENPF